MHSSKGLSLVDGACGPVFAFLYLPIAVLIVYSFNGGESADSLPTSDARLVPHAVCGWRNLESVGTPAVAACALRSR